MLLKRFIRDVRGAVSVEYSLMASLVAFAIVSGLRMTGLRLVADFGRIQSDL